MQNATITKTKIIIKKCRWDQKKFSDFVYTVEEFWGSSHWFGYGILTILFRPCVDCVTGAKRGGGREKGREHRPSPSVPNPPPFPLLPNPLPLSTPATQANLVYPNQHQNAVFTPMASEYRTLSLCMFTKRNRRCLSLKHTFQIHCENERK